MISKLQISNDKTKSNGVMTETPNIDLWLPQSHIKPRGREESKEREKQRQTDRVRDAHTQRMKLIHVCVCVCGIHSSLGMDTCYSSPNVLL